MMLVLGAAVIVTTFISAASWLAICLPADTRALIGSAAIVGGTAIFLWRVAKGLIPRS